MARHVRPTDPNDIAGLVTFVIDRFDDIEELIVAMSDQSSTEADRITADIDQLNQSNAALTATNQLLLQGVTQVKTALEVLRAEPSVDNDLLTKLDSAVAGMEQTASGTGDAASQLQGAVEPASGPTGTDATGTPGTVPTPEPGQNAGVTGTSTDAPSGDQPTVSSPGTDTPGATVAEPGTAAAPGATTASVDAPPATVPVTDSPTTETGETTPATTGTTAGTVPSDGTPASTGAATSDTAGTSAGTAANSAASGETLIGAPADAVTSGETTAGMTGTSEGDSSATP